MVCHLPESHMHRFASFAGAILSLFLLTPSAVRADAAATPPKIDLSQTNIQPAYPDSAKGKDEHGEVQLAVYVEASGSPSKVTVDTTSGFADLDQAAVAAVQGWHFVPATKDGAAVAGWTKVFLRFQMSNDAQNPTGHDQGYVITNDDNRIICKSNVAMTGTLIPPKPVCRSKRQWNESSEQTKRDLERTIMQESGSSHGQ